jgi:UDPglucose--hexose-1-phosphate uridylyltransferase
VTVDRPGGWVVRAFPNKYPALRIEGPLERKANGPYGRVSGVGAHEVIVESRSHAVAGGMDPGAGAVALRVARDRMRDLSRDRRFRAMLWFRNHGPEAGATLAHPHAQIVALPAVPPRLRRQARRAREHWRQHERDLMQDLLDHDLDDRRRVLFEDERVVALCPWAPQVPFETWLVPQRAGADFADADDATVAALAAAMVRVLAACAEALADPPYNAVLHTAPLGEPSEGFRWHVRLLPRLPTIAGFELGAGAAMHGTPPEEAAEVLRAARR